MNPPKTKFRLIFVPFLVVIFSTVGIYTFLNWLVIARLHLFTIDEEIPNIFIPIVLAWIPLIIWVRPRLKLLDYTYGKSKSPIGGRVYVGGITLLAPLIVAQLYMVSATGKLTNVDYISEIEHKPASRYYMAEHFYAAKRIPHVFTTFRVSGKHNTNYDMAIYVAVPVFDHLFPDTNKIAKMREGLNDKGLIIINGKLSNKQYLKSLPADSIRRIKYLNPSLVMPKYGDAGKYGALVVLTRGFRLKDESVHPQITPPAWLTVKYMKTISNRLTREEKDERYKSFVVQCDTDFKNTKFNRLVYMSRVTNSYDLTY